MKIISVVGARPNFIKVAPLHRAFGSYPGVTSKIVHTGQHYDTRLSNVFFDQLGLPPPDYQLAAGSSTPTQQTAEIMRKLEPVLMAEQPDWVLVVGDVTSTLAAALTAVRLGIRVAHVEAGLRAHDRRMPEEINRILTDHVSDLLFVTEQAGLDNLKREGIPGEKVHLVGNVLIDNLVQCRQRANQLNTVERLGLLPRRYVLMTMHRPANVDHEAGLTNMVQVVADVAIHKTVLFPLHPRTRANLAKFNLINPLMALPNVRLLEPQGYLEFLNLMEHAALVITDSGGVQEETTYLQVSCLTLRNTTERPVTVELGTNQLVLDVNPQAVREKMMETMNGAPRVGRIPPLWDGQTAGRIAEILLVQP